MNRSYSKIRHIQEANQNLEKRLLSEAPLDSTKVQSLLSGPMSSEVKNFLMKLVKVMTYAPTKAIDLIKAIITILVMKKSFHLQKGHNEVEFNSKDRNKISPHMHTNLSDSGEEQLMNLLKPHVNVTQEEIAKLFEKREELVQKLKSLVN